MDGLIATIICICADKACVAKHTSSGELKHKGESARQRAIDDFIPERWIEEILE